LTLQLQTRSGVGSAATLLILQLMSDAAVCFSILSDAVGNGLGSKSMQAFPSATKPVAKNLSKFWASGLTTQWRQHYANHFAVSSQYECPQQQVQQRAACAWEQSRMQAYDSSFKVTHIRRTIIAAQCASFGIAAERYCAQGKH